MEAVLSEAWLRLVVLLFVRIVEGVGAVIIFTGACVGFVRFIAAAAPRQTERFTTVRLDIGRFLVLGLEFQLAADLLRTTVAPSFNEIGKLAAVAAIRTALNYFLQRETITERAELSPNGTREP
jgi:uncharacterized membrane protein